MWRTHSKKCLHRNQRRAVSSPFLQREPCISSSTDAMACVCFGSTVISNCLQQTLRRLSVGNKLPAAVVSEDPNALVLRTQRDLTDKQRNLLI